MSLLWPWALATLLILPSLLGYRWWTRRRRRQSTVVFSSLALVRSALPGRSMWRRRVPLWLFATGLAIDDHHSTMLGSTLEADPKATLIERLGREGPSFVGQEPVRLSTAPVSINGRLEPRPITLRVYAARTAEGWTIMPGGFARVGSTADTTAIAMQRGGHAADVWVVSAKPVERVSLLPQEGEHAVGGGGGSARRGRVVVQHRIDHRGAAAVLLVDHVREGGRGRIEEARHLGIHHAACHLI